MGFSHCKRDIRQTGLAFELGRSGKSQQSNIAEYMTLLQRDRENIELGREEETSISLPENDHRFFQTRIQLCYFHFTYIIYLFLNLDLQDIANNRDIGNLYLREIGLHQRANT